MTKLEMFGAIKAKVADNEEMVKFLDHEIELLVKKSENRKPTKTQKENKALCDALVATLEVIGEGTISEITAKCDALSGFSNQKVSALAKMLCEEGKVVKRVEGRKSIFSLAIAPEVVDAE